MSSKAQLLFMLGIRTQNLPFEIFYGLTKISLGFMVSIVQFSEFVMKSWVSRGPITIPKPNLSALRFHVTPVVITWFMYDQIVVLRNPI